MKFEWDPEKAVENFINHGVTFEESTAVFNDFFAIEYLDDRYPETRYQRIGLAASGILFVVFTMRGDDDEITRIISARKATTQEEVDYFKQSHEK